MFLFCDCPCLHRHSFICTWHNTLKLPLIYLYLHNGTSLAQDQGRGESKPKKSLGLPKNQKKFWPKTQPSKILYWGVKVFNKGLSDISQHLNVIILSDSQIRTNRIILFYLTSKSNFWQLLQSTGDVIQHAILSEAFR